MRGFRNLLLAGNVALCATPAFAASTLKFGGPPSWVRPQPIPDASTKNADAPIAVLLKDEQVRFDRGTTTSYSEGAIKYQNAQGLAAGNIFIVWQPETDAVTVNKLQIRRGGKIIDVLAAGQTFTILRRETNLDAATLDGTLTATLQPEGLQVGDIIDFATTTEHKDPVLKGHVEAMFGAWDGLPLQTAHAALSWPTDMPIRLRETPNLPSAQRTSSGGMTMVELTGHDVQPLIPPKGAPDRFKIGRLAEATDFASWTDLSNLFTPLFREASAIPATGPLHDEVEKIRAASTSPKARTEQALALVQDRVRYVALLMGQGGYVPAPAETTWSRRFGDCKAKTALLLGILHSLGIQAEPVLVQARLGDIIAERLPIVALFNHVLVRAHIGGKDYWLDGTRTGDTDLDAIETPNFGWGLPLVEHAQLVRMIPAPLTSPSLERHVAIDARAGVYTPATIEIDEVSRGDSAVELNAGYSGLTAEQRDQQLHEEAKSFFDSFTGGSSSVQFDKAKREFRMTIKGTAKLGWKDGWFNVPTSVIAFDPDFDRTADPFHDAPIAVGHPTFVKDEATIRLPTGFAAQQKLQTPVHETLAGIEYARSEAVDGDTVTVDSSERSIAPEVPYKDAVAAEARLRTLYNDDVYLKVPGSYHGTDADLASLAASTPTSANEYFVRADSYAAHNKMDRAVADLDAGLALDPKNSWALQRRASISLQKQHFGDAEKDLQTAASANPDDPTLAASRGLLALEKGDINGASAAFDVALARDAKNPAARFGRARVLLARGKVQESLSDLNALLGENPRNVEALAFRAQILNYRSDDAGARRDIDAALAIDPHNAWALAVRAAIAIDKKDYTTATDFVAKALAQDPNQSYARMLQATLLNRRGAGVSTESYDQAVAAAPNDPAPLVNRAIAHEEAKDLDAAAKDLAAALALDPGNPRALALQSEIARQKGDYTGAVKSLTAALVTSPQSGFLLSARAEVYRQMHEFDLALADTDAAMKAGLVSPELRLLRINILVSEGNATAATTEADKLVEENPTSDLAMVAAGKTYAAMGYPDKAMTAFDRAIAIHPESYIYLNRAQIRPHDDIAGKLADIDAALKIEPGQEDAIAEKAKILSRAGRNAEAIALYDSAIKAALDSSSLELLRAVALQRAGRTREAAAVFNAQRAKAKTVGDLDSLCSTKAISGVVLDSALLDCRRAEQMDANYPELNEVLGLVLLKLGKLPEALAAYDKAIASKSGAQSYLGRAIVHERMGDLSDAQADVAKARQLRPNLDDLAYDYGLKLDIPSPAKAVPASLPAKPK